MSHPNNYVTVPMHRHKRDKHGNAPKGADQVLFSAKFNLPDNPLVSHFVGFANYMFSLPSVSGVRGRTRPPGLKPRGDQIVLPYDKKDLWLPVYNQGPITVYVVDDPANAYTKPNQPLSAIRIQADDRTMFEFTPTGSDRLLVVATHNGDLITLPVKVLKNMGNIIQRAWEKDPHRLMNWRGGIRRVDAWQ